MTRGGHEVTSFLNHTFIGENGPIAYNIRNLSKSQTHGGFDV